MPNLYIIAGCNGSGKTTASESLLPDLLDCREFVNADSIALGISPYNIESVAFEAGRIMLQRINYLLDEKKDFAFETTLSTRSYVGLIKRAKELGYNVNLIFFWLDSLEMAKDRVLNRTRNGGHNIPPDVIERRYYRGIQNLINLYMPVCDTWCVYNNMDEVPHLISLGIKDDLEIIDEMVWKKITEISKN